MKAELPILISGAVITVSALSFLIWNMKKKKFEKVGTVKTLFFFPIKSLKAIEVPTLECTPIGVKYLGILDRSFMLISGDNVLISQREEPRLTLLSISVTKDKITITDPDNNVLEIDVNLGAGDISTVIYCKLHTFKAGTIDCGDTAAKFFQTFLGRNDVRLVRNAQDRALNGKFDPLLHSITGSKSDFSPVNVLSQSSLDALNSRMEKPVTVYNFRPNVLIDDSLPFDEDNWSRIKFSSGAIVNPLLPCGRCVLTTNDPETGIKTNKEPLTTLRKFRKLNDPKINKILNYSPCFGVNCWLLQTGSVSVGDDVFAIVQKGLFTYKEESASSS